jgi:hypothetical protein
MAAESKNGPYAQSPPPFGHAMLKYFGFAPGYTNLNIGEINIMVESEYS